MEGKVRGVHEKRVVSFVLGVGLLREELGRVVHEVRLGAEHAPGHSIDSVDQQSLSVFEFNQLNRQF